MDPNEIKLTTTQKIVPLLKAINEEVPWQFMVVIGISLWCGIFVPTYVPPLHGGGDFFARRVLLGAVCALIGLLVSGGICLLIEEKLAPLIVRIKFHYEKESLVVKKKVLDDVIDDEILRK